MLAEGRRRHGAELPVGAAPREAVRDGQREARGRRALAPLELAGGPEPVLHDGERARVQRPDGLGLW